MRWSASARPPSASLPPPCWPTFYPERDRNRILSIFYLAIPVGAALGYLAGGQLGPLVGLARALLRLRHSRPDHRRALWLLRPRARARRQRPHPQGNTRSPHHLPRPLHQPRLSHRHLRPGHAHLCHGRHLGLGAEFLRRSAGLSVGNASLVSAPSPSSTASPEPSSAAGSPSAGCAPTTAPSTCSPSGASPSPCPAEPGLLRPPAWAVPALFAAEFFLFLNTGPLNAAIVNSVSGPIRATAIACNLFIIHCFGDTFSPQIIGAISDRAKPAHRPRRNPHLPGRLLRHPR
jgi:hypothetical protein